MAYRVLLAVAFIFTFSGRELYGQCDMPPATDNCENAPLLCAFDEIDGYCTSMSQVITGNGPAPMCAEGGAPHNVIWFAFHASCASLNMTLLPSNCVGVQGQVGIQAAIYGYGFDGLCTDSHEQPAQVIACQSIPCFDAPWTFDATGLTIGQIYYFMVDGCVGSYCDIEIVVNSPCGDPEIGPWTQSIQGPQEVCVDETTLYTIQAPIGGLLYTWYGDGEVIQEGADNQIHIGWVLEGTYQLCVDVSNHCISESENPPQTCITIVISGLQVSISDNDSTLTVTVSGGTMPYSYLWSTGDTLQTIPKTPGMHIVQVTDADGCVQSATILITHLEDIAKKGSGVILYPNPTNGMLFLRPLEEKEFAVNLEYRCFNALGTLVTQGVIPNGSSQISVNTSPWPAGRYLVQLMYEGGEMEVIPIVVVH